MADQTTPLPPRLARRRLFRRVSIGKKIAVTFLLVLVFAAANIAVVKSQLDDFHDIAATVNIAGKLRWFSQRMAAQAGGLSAGTAAAVANIQQDIHSINRKLQVLKDGGTVGNQEIRGLDAIHAAPLAMVLATWLDYKTDLERIVAAYLPAGAGPANAMLHGPAPTNMEIMTHSVKMLQHAESLVTSIVSDFQRRQNRTLLSMYALLLADMLILLVIFMMARQYMVKPLRALSAQSRQMISGSYEIQNDYSFTDEIGELTASFNESARRIGDLITDLQAEKELLHESSAMFMGLAANTMAGIYIIQDGRFRFANHKMAELLGYESAEQLMGAKVIDIFVLEDRKALQDSIERRLRGDEVEARFERRVLRQDERTMFLEFFSSVVTLGGGPCLTGVALDITQRKETEASLRLASLVYENSSEAMVITNEDAVIVTVNPAFTTITGFDPEDVVGQKINMLSSGRQDKEFYKNMWQSIVSTGKWQGDIWNRRKNGQEYAERLSITTTYNQNGSVRFRIGLFSDITEKKQSDAVIWKQANYDHLTGLANRQLFHDRLEQAVVRASRTSLSVALIFLDLDFFKEINDTLGHDKGDDLLRQVATRLTHCLRASDIVARLGGDEFIIVMGDIEVLDVLPKLCRTILNALAAPYVLGKDAANISASMGVAFYPQDAQDPVELLKNADLAMYAAKEQGRNQFAMFTPELRKTAQSRRQLTRDLVDAVNADQFVLHYQPIVDLATGRVSKAEALVRWMHPEFGPVPPAEFIPFAEDNGLIVQIGDWVFREAAQQVAQWRKQYCSDFQVSVNVSPVQFQIDGLDQNEWLEHLRDLDLPGDSILVEITERLLMNIDDAVKARMLYFRESGVQFALDDFGTGYSSLSYLKKFDIDYIKIDQSFVRNLTPQSDDLALCEAIIVMAHRLGLKVVAEGIETPEQYQLLAQAGCDYGQGYVFSRALPADEFIGFLIPGGEPDSKARQALPA